MFFRSRWARTARPIVGVLGLLLLQGLPGRAHAQERDQRIEDLRDRVVGIRSIDHLDEDFSDLAPLASAIGDARIIQLGESTHGDGAGFAAKVRLVKFLHRELGFDVLLWESGMYDLDVVNDSLRAGVDPATAAGLGVFAVWSGTQELLPLFEYARSSHVSGRPLDMAGFDPQFSGLEVDDLEIDLFRLIDRSGDEAVRDTARALARSVIESFRRLIAVETAEAEYMRELRRASVTGTAMSDSLRVWQDTRQESFAPTPPDLEQFLAVAEGLLQLFRIKQTALAGSFGEREVAFMEQALGNLREYGIIRYERTLAARSPDGPASTALATRAWNRRDVRMADNLTWLAEEVYPDRKLIVWAHNGHIMNAYYEPDWSALAHEPTADGARPMGTFIAEAFDDAVYTIGFTAFAGEYAPVTLPVTQRIGAMPEESVEALLHELGHDQAFVDFRALPPGHWLRRPATMTIRGFMPEVMDDWTRVVDGIFFIDRMTPATPLRRQ